jgi:plastocyanin
MVRRMATLAALGLGVLVSGGPAAAASTSGAISGEHFIAAGVPSAALGASRSCPPGYTVNDPTAPQAGSFDGTSSFNATAGDTLTIQNLDPIPHSIVSDCSGTSVAFSSGAPVSEGTISVNIPSTLPTGTYTFHCGVHPYMYASLYVYNPNTPGW